jgi:meiotically up-regulated gene 157 (Mug157) protein
MYAGGVLKRVNGLTYDKLNYFVRAGYVEPKKVKKESLYYNDFSEEDVELIKRAWTLISRHDVRTREAFERAGERAKDLQLTLNLRTPPDSSDS